MRGLFLALFLFPVTIYSQSDLPYKVGEYSAFDISFGGIKVGSAEMKIEKQIKINGVSTFHIVGKGKTASFFDWFFKVRDVYETYLDTSKIRPVKFVRDIHEGGYEKKQQYIFKHSVGKVFWKDTSYVIFPQLRICCLLYFMQEPLIKTTCCRKNHFLFQYLWMRKIIH